MLKTSSETTFYDFFRPSKQKLWKNPRFLTSPRCNSAPPKGPKPCKKTMFLNTRSKIHCKLPYFCLGAKFWSRCEIVFGPPPPPAKADIATAILTNVIEHLVLLLPPNKHAFTAKAVWADFQDFWPPMGVSDFCLFFGPSVLLDSEIACKSAYRIATDSRVL